MKNNNVKRKVVISTSAQVIGQLLSAVIAVFILKILTNKLGIKQYGVYATIVAFVTTFSLLTDFGLNAITGREIAKRPEEAESIIGHNLGLRLFLCLIMVPVISLLGYAFYPHATGELRLGILVLSSYLFFDATRSVTLAFFTAKIRNDIGALISFAQQLFMLILVIAAAFSNWGLFGFLYIFIAANFIAAVLSLFAIRKHIRVRPLVNTKKWKNIIFISFSLGIIQIINMLYLKVDSIMLSTIKGTDAVGIYGVAYSLILAFLALPSFIMSALIPSMATSTKAVVQKIVQKAFQYMAILACLLATGCLIVSKDIVMLVASKDFAPAASPFAILGFASAFSYLNSVFGFASVSLNKHHKLVYISISTLLLNILINLILIPRYSYIGAAWATFTCELIALTAIYKIFRKETGLHIRVFKNLIKPGVSATVVILIMYSLHFIWTTSNNLLNLAVSSVMILSLYSIVLLLIKGIPEEIITVCGNIAKRIKTI